MSTGVVELPLTGPCPPPADARQAPPLPAWGSEGLEVQPRSPRPPAQAFSLPLLPEPTALQASPGALREGRQTFPDHSVPKALPVLQPLPLVGKEERLQETCSSMCSPFRSSPRIPYRVSRHRPGCQGDVAGSTPSVAATQVPYWKPSNCPPYPGCYNMRKKYL